MPGSGYTFLVVKWQSSRADISRVCQSVLVDELGLENSIFESGVDESAYHVMVYNAEGSPVAATRMQVNGRIDYIAVLPAWRGNTVGGALISYLNHIAHINRIETLWSEILPATKPFFVKNGFDVLPEADAESPQLLHVVREVGNYRKTSTFLQ